MWCMLTNLTVHERNMTLRMIGLDHCQEWKFKFVTLFTRKQNVVENFVTQIVFLHSECRYTSRALYFFFLCVNRKFRVKIHAFIVLIEMYNANIVFICGLLLCLFNRRVQRINERKFVDWFKWMINGIRYRDDSLHGISITLSQMYSQNSICWSQVFFGLVGKGWVLWYLKLKRWRSWVHVVAVLNFSF